MINKPTIRRTGRILLTGLLVVNLLLGYVGQSTLSAQAQSVIPDAIDTTKSGVVGAPQYGGVEDSIRDYLCVPDDNNLGTALYVCITKLYRFGIAFGGIALVFFIVFAGYMYMTGGESSKEKAKGILLSGLTGMAIILSSYVLLNFINPDLVKIKPIQPPIFTASSLPSCEEVGYGQDCVLPSGQVQTVSNGGSYGGKGCKPITNDASPASVNNLTKSCFGQYGAEVVKQASIVASSESGGNPSLPVGAGSCGKEKPAARCTGGEIPVWGLYQINLTVHKVGGLNCPAAFGNKEWTCSKSCTVTNPALYNQCVAAAKNATNNINAACAISQASLSAGKPRFNAWGNTQNEHGKRCGF